ncbi:MAG: hypothetical protein ACYTGB_16425 [Planctomycetota bacterium]|jgi:hypothetical protein
MDSKADQNRLCACALQICPTEAEAAKGESCADLVCHGHPMAPLPAEESPEGTVPQAPYGCGENS